MRSECKDISSILISLANFKIFMTLKELKDKIDEFYARGATDDVVLSVANEWAYQPIMEVEYFTTPDMSGPCVVFGIDLSHYGVDGTIVLDKRYHK